MPDERGPAAIGRRQRAVPGLHVALDAGLVEHVQRHHRARRAVPLDHAVHLAEELRGPGRAAIGRLAGVVGLVPRAELAHAQAAEVLHQPPDLRLYCATDGSLAFLITQVVGGDVQQDREAVAARALHVGPGREPGDGAVHRVPRDEVAHPLELRALEGRLVEHRGRLVADAHADGRARLSGGRDEGEARGDGGEQERRRRGILCANQRTAPRLRWRVRTLTVSRRPRPGRARAPVRCRRPRPAGAR